MKIGLFFGTFNPIHQGHLILAHHIQQYSSLDQVWFVVTPRSPFKKNENLTDDYTRLNMVELAIENYPNLFSSTIEFRLQQPNYTVTTLAILREKYPHHEFSLIMGEDNLGGLHKWRNSEFLVSEYDIWVYPRLHPGSKTPQVDMQRIFRVENAPVIEISSTFIRQAIAEKKNVRPLLPPEVFQFIDGSNLYQ